MTHIKDLLIENPFYQESDLDLLRSVNIKHDHTNWDLLSNINVIIQINETDENGEEKMNKILADIDKLLDRRIDSMREGNPFHEFCKEYLLSFKDKVESFKNDLDTFVPNIKDELEVTIINLNYFHTMETKLVRKEQFDFTQRIFNQIEHKIHDIIV